MTLWPIRNPADSHNCKFKTSIFLQEKPIRKIYWMKRQLIALEILRRIIVISKLVKIKFLRNCNLILNKSKIWQPHKRNSLFSWKVYKKRNTSSRGIGVTIWSNERGKSYCRRNWLTSLPKFESAERRKDRKGDIKEIWSLRGRRGRLGGVGGVRTNRGVCGIADYSGDTLFIRLSWRRREFWKRINRRLAVDEGRDNPN